jgi:hypothetical protein
MAIFLNVRALTCLFLLAFLEGCQHCHLLSVDNLPGRVATWGREGMAQKMIAICNECLFFAARHRRGRGAKLRPQLPRPLPWWRKPAFPGGFRSGPGGTVAHSRPFGCLGLFLASRRLSSRSTSRRMKSICRSPRLSTAPIRRAAGQRATAAIDKEKSHGGVCRAV